MLRTNRKSRIIRNKRPTGVLQYAQSAFFAFLFITVGCRSQSDDPNLRAGSEVASNDSKNIESFELQVADVRSQKSTAIRMTQASIEGSQLNLLTDLTQLDELVLDQGTITDSSFRDLIALRSLRHLRLRNSPLTDTAVANLTVGDLPNLQILNLPQSAFSAEGLNRIKRLPKLVQLRLGASKIDDRACEVISQFPKLQSLHLIGPKLSDSALEHLATAPELASLYIDDCKLSDEAWKLLFSVKPQLHVHIDQQHHDRDPNTHPN
jgi:Leucine-rich repeat (LRR) protein